MKRILSFLTSKPPTSLGWTCAIVLALACANLVLDAIIIKKVPFTEIDWRAYMDEVGGVLGGELEYSRLRGPTGPLVYPAGFVWIFAAIRIVLDGSVQLGQWLFAVLHSIFIGTIAAIYVQSQAVPTFMLPVLLLSKRLHSIFVLRMFNDAIAMMFAYTAVMMSLWKQWLVASLALTLGLSVKMNVLLFAPMAVLLLYRQVGFVQTFGYCCLVALVQIAVAIPFLLADPVQYIQGAFDFGRSFLQPWSVNWSFLPPDVFGAVWFGRGLLVLHVLCLCVFAARWWYVLPTATPKQTMFVLFAGNFIGIAFARSLHYQFYVWYGYSLPALLWVLPFPTALRVLLLVTVEVVWNMSPPSLLGGVVLLSAHMVLLLGVMMVSPTAPVFRRSLTGE